VGCTRKKLIEAAQSLLAVRPDEATQLGQLAAVIGDQCTELWQDNVTAVEVFVDMMTQWNVGPAGVVGMRYEALPVVLRLRGVPPADRPDVFRCLRVMERAAIEEMNRG